MIWGWLRGGKDPAETGDGGRNDVQGKFGVIVDVIC